VGKTKTKSEKIRELLATGMAPCEVARRVGVRSGAVASAARRTGARGRPRKTVHPVEAACRYIEFMSHEIYNDPKEHEILTELVHELRGGNWKNFV
jgi:hypothetical protein